MADWGKIRSFLYGGILGGLLGVILAPRRKRRLLMGPGDQQMTVDAAFATAPCYRPDDLFT